MFCCCFLCFHTCTHAATHTLSIPFLISVRNQLEREPNSSSFSEHFVPQMQALLFISISAVAYEHCCKHVPVKTPYLLSDFRIPCSNGSLVEQSQKEIQLFVQFWKASVSKLQSMLSTRMNPLAVHSFYCKILAVWSLRPLLQIHEWF